MPCKAKANRGELIVDFLDGEKKAKTRNELEADGLYREAMEMEPTLQ